MIYREFIHNRTYPIVTYRAVQANGTVLADSDDRKEEELGDMPVLAITHLVIYAKKYNALIPSEVVVLGEPLENDDEEVARYFKDLK